MDRLIDNEGNVYEQGLGGAWHPVQVEAWARECIRETGGRGLILSGGGGVSPGTPPEAIDALVNVPTIELTARLGSSL